MNMARPSHPHDHHHRQSLLVAYHAQLRLPAPNMNLSMPCIYFKYKYVTSCYGKNLPVMV